jgi:hypothetical protein
VGKRADDAVKRLHYCHGDSQKRDCHAGTNSDRDQDCPGSGSLTHYPCPRSKYQGSEKSILLKLRSRWLYHQIIHQLKTHNRLRRYLDVPVAGQSGDSGSGATTH